MRAVVLAFVVALAACGPKPSPNGVTPNDAIVFIRTNVGDADLILDGHYVGHVAMLRGGVAVEPGKHHLELRHDEYFSTYLELDLAKAERKKIAMDLAPILP